MPRTRRKFGRAVVTDGSEAKLMVLRELLTVRAGQIAGHLGKGRHHRKSNRRQPLDWIPLLLVSLKANLPYMLSNKIDI